MGAGGLGYLFQQVCQVDRQFFQRPFFQFGQLAQVAHQPAETVHLVLDVLEHPELLRR